MRQYKIIYKDKFGEEETEIFSDGSIMYVTLRGIKFEGSDFESFKGEVDKSKFDYEMFQDDFRELTNFIMEVIFPIKIEDKNKIITEEIKFTIEVGKELEIKGLDSIVNKIELNTSFRNFISTKKVEWFEDAIIEIQNMLPKKMQIKTCLSCKYSNYHPVGNGMFGSLYCFKKIKKELSTIRDKYDLMSLMTNEAVENEEIFNVQEIFDCSEHQFITKNDWTYKDWDYKTKCVNDYYTSIKRKNHEHY